MTLAQGRGPITRPTSAIELVLLGAGHAHVEVLRRFARRPEPNVRLTLVSPEPHALYSGMLPGVIAGLYTAEEAIIDLGPLCRAAGARLICAAAAGLDLQAKALWLKGGATISFSVLSLNVGLDGPVEPAGPVPLLRVRPIGSLLAAFDQLRARVVGESRAQTVAVIGGGAAGVEVLLAMRARLRAESLRAGQPPDRLSFTLVTEDTLLAGHNGKVRAALRRLLEEKGVLIEEHRRVTSVANGAFQTGDGGAIHADHVVLATPGLAPAWLQDSGLCLDGRGFVAVDPTLQASGQNGIFAAGDCAALQEAREKAGVFAVRAGPVLARNLRRTIRGEALEAWHPRRRHLALLSTSERYAVASFGPLKAEGQWVWRLKDLIDRRWVSRFRH